MLIHLEGTVKNDIAEFDLPQLYFQQGQTVAVTYVSFLWKPQARHFHALITSSLVDKSPSNPNQQILNIYQKAESNYSSFTPTQLAEYKIQCLDLKSSVFKIEIFSYDKTGNTLKRKNILKRINLTLLISDARI